MHYVSRFISSLSDADLRNSNLAAVAENAAGKVPPIVVSDTAPQLLRQLPEDKQIVYGVIDNACNVVARSRCPIHFWTVLGSMPCMRACEQNACPS